MFLERVYDLAYIALKPLKGILKPNSWAEKAMIVLEKYGKGVTFNCQMCGQCVLHSTGMICPMNCPKNLRNGPCGGVRPNGHCEVKPEMRCIWVRAYEGAQKSEKYGSELMWLLPPINRSLQDSSSWVNMLHDIDTSMKVKWAEPEKQEELMSVWGKNE